MEGCAQLNSFLSDWFYQGSSPVQTGNANLTREELQGGACRPVSAEGVCYYRGKSELGRKIVGENQL